MSDLAETPVARTDLGSAYTFPAAVASALSWLPLAAIVATFLVVSTAYNLAVPLYEAPDERAHALYVKSIAERSKLPTFSTPEDYEAWQPPFYYAVGGAVLKTLSLGPIPYLEQNPRFPAETDSYLHVIDESFPYSEPVLAIHVLRGINGIFAAGTMVIVYFMALILFPERKLLALSAAATTGFVPQFAFIGGAVSNDPASVFFAAGTAFFGLKYMREARSVWVVLAAVALSLGALSKSMALLAALVPAGAVLLSTSPWRDKLKLLAVIGVLPFLVAGWFYVRSLAMWGAIYPVDHFWTLRPTPIWDPLFRKVFWELLRHSYWYFGGAVSVEMSRIVYDLLDLLSCVALGGIIVTFVSRTLSAVQSRGLMLLTLLSVAAFLGIVYFSVTSDFSPQGRYLFVAQPALGILLPLGLSAIFSRDIQRDHSSVFVLPVLLLAVNAYIFAVVLPREY